MAETQQQTLALWCRVGTLLCALPLDHVAETMRPIAIQPVSGVPAFVLGVAIIRGAPVPVVDAGRLLGGEPVQPARFVTLKVGPHRHVALVVEQVLNVKPLHQASLDKLPPLLHFAKTDAVSKMGALDSELLMVLEAAHVVPEELWSQLEAVQSR